MPGKLFRANSAPDPKSRHLVPWQKGDRRDGQNLIVTEKNASVGGKQFAALSNYSNYSAVGSSALLADTATKHC